MFLNILLLAVLLSLMLRIYKTEIIFIYTVRHVGVEWDKGEVEPCKSGLKPQWHLLLTVPILCFCTN